MEYTIKSIDEMRTAVHTLLKCTKLNIQMNEETSFNLKVVLNELITSNFKASGYTPHQVKVAVDVEDKNLVVTVGDKDLGLYNPSESSYEKTENSLGLAIINGLCHSVERYPTINRVIARLMV